MSLANSCGSTQTNWGTTTPEISENAERRAERIMAEEWRRSGWTEMVSQRKSAAGRLALAARLRRETILPLQWIARRVQLGASKSANGKLQAWVKGQAQRSADSVMVSVEKKEASA